jgi:lipopolysaccharide transport system permease protein
MVPSSDRHTASRAAVRKIAVREIIYTPESRIRSPKRLLAEMAQDLWLSRTLAWRLFVRDIQSQYRSSFLGTLWAVVPAAITAAGLTFASQSGVINVGETDVPYPAFVMLGTILWQTFLEAFNGPEAAIKASRTVLSRVKFPHEAIILSQLGQVLFNLLLKLVLLVVLFVIFSVTVSWKIIFAPVALISLILLGTGIGLFLVPINHLVQDISRAMEVILLVWFFLTPVIYPVPDQAVIAMLVKLNPVTPLLVTARELMTTGVVSQPIGFLLVSGLAIASLLFGWLVFRLSIPFLVERIS